MIKGHDRKWTTAGTPLKQAGKRWKGFFRRRKSGTPDNVTEEEILSMINEGHEKGVLQSNEAEMLHNIFEYADKDANDIMTHRKNIAALDGNMLFRDMLEYVGGQNYSRYPVYLENIDNIIGVVHIKDILNFILNQEVMDYPIQKLNGLIHEVPFIPETRNINNLFQGMQTQKVHMAIVVDEYGQTSGLVTMEDIIEEVMGNIQDEHDQEEVSIVRQNDGSYLMSGMAPLEDVWEVLSIEDEDDLEEYDTLNGFLVSLIDKIPSDGETFRLSAKGYSFEVLSVEDRVIKKVRVTEEKQDRETRNKTESCQYSGTMIK